MSDLPHSGSDTSRAAAESMRPHAGSLRRKVCEYIADQLMQGATDEQIQDALQMPASTERPRRGELVERGFVIDLGVRRPTRSGRSAIVWFCTELGMRACGRETAGVP